MLEQIRYRAKALIAAGGLILVGLAEYLVAAPDTGRVLEQLMPAPWDQAAPLLLGGLAAVLVHEWPNAPKPGTAGTISAAQADEIRRLIDDHLGGRIRLASNRAPAAVAGAPLPAHDSPQTSAVQLLPPLGGGN